MSERRFAILTKDTMTPEQRRTAEAIEATPRPEQRRTAEAIEAGPHGAGLQGPFNALLRSPELCDRVQRVGAYIRFGSAIPKPLNELAICMVGRKWKAQYEFWAHRRQALEAGLAAPLLDAVAIGRRPEGMSDDEAAVYDFTAALLDTGRVPDAVFDRVKGRFGEQGVIDLTGAVGFYCLMSMVLNVDRVPVPEGETPPLP